MIETILIFVFMLYILPMIVCIAWHIFWKDPIASISCIPIINLLCAVIYLCTVIASIIAIIIERFPNLIYNYKKYNKR